ncbi:MAG: cytidine deaminase [Spirochaetia bacterium]|jgi:cytidine deaminase|nr:cytidine deaminase [Spirochaetia bacterium]
MKDESDLFEAALKVAEHSYSPYSKFRVGAAILCEDGSVITGANVENRSFGLTICAERSALVTAISEGKKSFSAIAIATPDAEYPVSPCGACRQVLSEFFPPEAPVSFGNSKTSCVNTTIAALFPFDALHELAEEGKKL